MTLTVAPPQTFLKTGKRSVSVSPLVSECTVAQAAEILDVPEACVHSWLNIGQIAFRLDDDGERRVQRDSLLDFEEQWKRGLAGLAEIVRLDQEMGLYDD